MYRLGEERLCHRLEHVLAHTTFGADPVVRQVLKRRARRDASIWIADLWIIDVTACQTFPFLHVASPS
jgi:hypothetical protein